MAVTSTQTGDTVTIQVIGRFDFATHRDFLNAYKDLPRGQKKFVVDLSGTEYMDSSAMGMLLQLREHGDKSQPVELINGNEGIREILRIANFDKLFKVA